MSEKLSLEEKIDKMQNEIDNLKKECEYWAKEVEDITELSLQKMRGPYISFEYLSLIHI